MLSSSVHVKIQRLGVEEEPPMTLANEGASWSIFDKRRCCKQTMTDYKSATFNTWRREKKTTTDHIECIKMTSRTKHHDSNEYEKAPRLRYTLNYQASIGFVDNL